LYWVPISFPGAQTGTVNILEATLFIQLFHPYYIRRVNGDGDEDADEVMRNGTRTGVALTLASLANPSSGDRV